MASNPIGWFEIYVQDMPRAKKFYESVFKTKLERLETPPMESPAMELWAFSSNMEEYGCSGALVKMEGVPPSKGLGTLVYFSTDDCSVEEKRVAQAGGKVERTKTSIGNYGFISLAIDTEGNMFGIHSMK